MAQKIHIVDAVLANKNTILMVRQRKAIAYGLWGFPGGHVESGESPMAAIKRELNEELGIAHIDNLVLLKTSVVGDSLHANTFFTRYSGPINLDMVELMDSCWLTSDEIRALGDKLRSPWILPVLSLLER
jgi:8-oxo-dGTP diphosphatase